ncbi:MAG: hypothetical protein K0U72_09995 [Gammaproteobacteria bacterium]|nr:hypothetical protein [Gammaproteobacteria bacterium]
MNMTRNRQLIHALFLLAAPVIVAWFGLSVPAAVLLVLLALVWRWLIVMSGWRFPEPAPDLILETISASHYVEKVRWCMDRMELDYTEKPVGGTLGAFYRGRTVPLLKAKTGAVFSEIGNSDEILRYVWGRYAYLDEGAAEFLRPTAARIEFERRLDGYGRMLQVWIYSHILNDKELALHAWGVNSPAIPLWQRQLLRILAPLQILLIRRAFRITPRNATRAGERISELLSEMNAALQDGRKSLLGGDELNYTDFAFAAMCGLWLMPERYGAGKADAVRIERERMPPAAQSMIANWEAENPEVIEYVQELYRNER